MKGIKYCGECAFYNWEKCLICENEEKLTGPFFDNCPLPDVEEVKHGEWVPLKQKKHWADTETISTNIVGFYCSVCGAEEKFKYRYCHCGAKMDEKEG